MIVGFHGRLGSGKDTAGDRLAQIVDLPSQRIAFADKLKQSAAALLNVPVEWLERHKNNPAAMVILTEGWEPSTDVFDSDGTPVDEPIVVSKLTVRQYLQRYGTEAHRDFFGSDFWVDQAFRDVDDKDYNSMLIYVTDVRFDNEAHGILKRGGVIVNVVGKDDPQMYWDESNQIWSDKESGSVIHSTEWPLHGCEYTIDNTRRDDQFASLDHQLYELAEDLRLPIKKI